MDKALPLKIYLEQTKDKPSLAVYSNSNETPHHLVRISCTEGEYLLEMAGPLRINGHFGKTNPMNPNPCYQKIESYQYNEITELFVLIEDKTGEPIPPEWWNFVTIMKDIYDSLAKTAKGIMDKTNARS